jgi:hypothetical protein
MKFRLIGAAFAVAATAALPAFALAAPTIRVEGAPGTLIPEAVVPVATGTTTVSDTTDTDTITVAANSATAQVATATGWFGYALGFDLFDFGGPSSFITQLGTDKMPTSFRPAWRLKVNHKVTPSGSDTTTLSANDAALWSFQTEFTAPELDLTVARKKIGTGGVLTARVTSYDNDGVPTLAAGAKVRFAGTTVVADALGRVTLVSKTAGPRFASATAAGAVRSPKRFICVYGLDNAPCSAITAPKSQGKIVAPTALIGETSGKRVEVAIFQRVVTLGAPGFDRPAKCRFLSTDRRTLATGRSCAKPTWLPAKVTDGHWTLALPTPLASGNYVVISRARTKHLIETVEQSGVNRVGLRIARAGAQ